MQLTSRRPYLIRAMYEWIVDNNLTPHLIVDANFEGVVAPPTAIQDGKVVLNVAMRATRNLELGNEYISFDARFGGIAQQVSVPIGAVMAIYSRENNEGLAFAPEQMTEAEEGEILTSSLAVIDGDLEVDDDRESPDDDNDPGPAGGGNAQPRRSHLKVVK